LEILARWNGEFLNLREFQAGAMANNATFDLAGRAEVSTNALSLHLDRVALSRTNQPRLVLEKSATIFLRKNADHLSVETSPLTLRGGNRLLSLETQMRWPERGHLTVSAENLNAAEAQNFFTNALPDFQLSELGFSGGWTNGPLEFETQIRGAVNLLKTNDFAFSVQATSEANGISLRKFSVLHEGNPVLAGSGILPAQIFPAARTNQIQVRTEKPINFRADTMPNTIFWDRIAALWKIKVHEPELHIAVSGTLEKPHGTIQAKIAQAQWAAKNPTHEIPALTDIRAEIGLNEEKIRLDQLSFFVEGQPLFARAILPVGDFSKNWKTAFDWRKASGRIWANNIEFAAFEKFTPGILVPQGRLQLDVAFAPNFQLDGTLKIENAATRPLPGTGPLSELHAELRFAGRRVVFEKTAALLGGQPVGITGELDFAQRRGELPLIDLRLLGDNVPLARQPEFILRGDLNLQLSNVTNATPLISGEVRLRDSLYLGDLKQLVPGRVASAKNRPPYFSVTNEFFANWRARVLVTGENFLKVRSPIFDGSISSNMRIVGTLREPFALGDMQVESGVIKFPFANFKTTQAFVTLTSEDPYRPQIFATATSRAFGYDLQLQLTGPVNQPIIEFSSTPPLTSEQIILMVTAGEVPNRRFDISTQQRAQKLALFLGKSLLSRFSDPNGAERLTITSGEEVTERGGETYGIEYKINDDWSIVGEYDRFGELNIGVKWRVYSK
jgi:translocation and assembly module TamB